MKKPPLRSFRIGNFKSIRDSGRVDFGWLTVFIGNNGAGKSSLLEALDTFRDVVVQGVDVAFQRWRGFEYVWNQRAQRELRHASGHRASYTSPISFALHWHEKGKELRLSQRIALGEGGNSIFIQQEQVMQRRPDRTERWTRNDIGEVYFQATDEERPNGLLARHSDDGDSMLKQFAWDSLDYWQFLMLNPEQMGAPKAQQRAKTVITLARDGSNVAEYLNDLRLQSVEAFDGLLETVRAVLPYAADLQPTLTSDLERKFYLKMKEHTFDVPGWLLSTGTLRIVALLACLRHPKPPPLLIIEEIENGLDPRTIHLIIEEIIAATSDGTTQVILTTHSPYLLDLLPLSSVVFVEREESGEPTFSRPANDDEKARWATTFGTGQLYTMSRLSREKRQ